MLPFLLAGDGYSTCIALPNPAGVTISGVAPGILPLPTTLHSGHPKSDDFESCFNEATPVVPGITIGGLPAYTLATPVGCTVGLHIYSRSAVNAPLLGASTVLGPIPTGL